VNCCACRFNQTVHQLPSHSSSQQNIAGDHETRMTDSRSPLLSYVTEPDDVQVHVISKQKEPSLLRALMHVVGPKLLQAHLCKLIADVLIFCGPVLQRSAC